MANEAIKVEGPYEVHDFTVATGTAISGMTLCKLTEPRTAAATTGADVAVTGERFAGIMAEDVSQAGNATEAGLYTKGVFDLYAGGGVGITAGDLVKLSGANIVEGEVAAIDIISGLVVGKAYETVAMGTPEVIEVHVGEFI